MPYTFDKTLRYTWPNGTPSKWEVLINTKAQYGYFEHDEQGEGGGLWFEGNVLQDYDGVYTLPKAVARALRDAGFIVEPEDC